MARQRQPGSTVAEIDRYEAEVDEFIEAARRDARRLRNAERFMVGWVRRHETGIGINSDGRYVRITRTVIGLR